MRATSTEERLNVELVKGFVHWNDRRELGDSFKRGILALLAGTPRETKNRRQKMGWGWFRKKADEKVYAGRALQPAGP